jgi:hypothetical protein
VAAFAWEHERTTADALARQVAEAEHFLHASAGERVASSQQPPPTALPMSSVGPPSGTDDPMVVYLHLQAAGVSHIKNLVTILLDSTSTSYAQWRTRFSSCSAATLSTATSSPTLQSMLATRCGGVAIASSCPVSPGHRADSRCHHARDLACPRDSVSRERPYSLPPTRRRASHTRAG